MTFPNAPSPLSYGAPLIDFSTLGDLGNQYYKGAEDKRKYDLARTFQGGVPKRPDGTPDIQAMTEALAQRGAVDLPTMQDQVDRGANQNTPGPYGGGAQQPAPAAQPSAASAPSSATPPIKSFRDAPVTPSVARSQPALSSAGTDNEGAQTLRGMATEIFGGRDVSALIPRFAAAFKVDPDHPLTPEQEAALKPVMGRSAAAMSGTQPPAGASAPQGAPQVQAAAPQAYPGLALPPGFTDPREAVTALRKAGDNLLRSNSQYAKARAQKYFEDADKIEAQAFGAPAGFERTASGQRPIPGGPEDPATVSAKVDAGLKPIPLTAGTELVDPKTGRPIAGNNSGLLDHATIDAMARQAMSGDTSVFQNLGRGAQGAENVVAVRKRIAEINSNSGESGSEQAMRNAEFGGIKSGQRTIGQKSANIELAATEFKQVLPVVQAASKAVSRTNYPDLNKIIQMYEEKTGDPNIVKFGGGVNTLVNLYARAISPTGAPTVSDKDHARLILNRAWSQGQFDAAVSMMSQEIDAALSSPEKVRDAMRERFLGGQAKSGERAASGAGVTSAPATSGAPSPADIEAEMRRRGLLK